MGLVFRYIVVSFLAACGLQAQIGRSVPILYTETPRYESAAVRAGGERFPNGAAIQLFAAGRKRSLVPAFAATADPAVSFDGRRVLFAAKPKTTDPWQIWEMPLNGGAPRCIVSGKSDAVAPFYLPADRIVYSIRTPSGFQIATLPLEGGAPLQLTYGTGNRVPA